MEKLKVMTVVGTRPEIIRLACVLKRLNESNVIDHVLVHTGQNYDYELNQIFFDDLELKKPDYFLDAVGKNAMNTIGLIIQKVDDVLETERPDAFLVLGDTNSCLSALVAKRRKIPVFHMEAGNRCFDQRVPEEINRRVIDHLADINLCYSDIAREYLLAEGLPADRVIKTGSPMQEVLSHYRERISNSQILTSLNLQPHGYFLVSVHREENVDTLNNFKEFISTLNAIAQKYKIPIIVSTHPRTRKLLDSNIGEINPLINFLKPFSFSDYNKLQMNAQVVMSDSGTISEESSILNFRALNIREAHERPEAMEEMGVIMTGLRKNRVLQGIELAIQQSTTARDFNIVSDYSMMNISSKVERIILSYVDYVNRKVWSKS